jgi:hypothetical protein
MFDKPTRHALHGIGTSTARLIVINTVVPLLAAYAIHISDETYMKRALDWLNRIPAEKNRITQLWEKNNEKIKTAFDSQASIGLYRSYCEPRRCLQCNIGVSILKSGV